MIGYVSGTLVEVRGERLIVDVNGIGYEVLAPYIVRHSFEEKLKLAGEAPLKVKIITLYLVSEHNPTPALIGFESPEQRIFFEKLISVSGVGAMKAAKALVLPVPTIAQAIEDNDVALIAKLPGFGRRTAEKVIAELRGRVVKETLLSDVRHTDLPSLDQEVNEEAIAVLRQMGFTLAEARNLVTAARKRNSKIETAEDVVQESLKRQV